MDESEMCCDAIYVDMYVYHDYESIHVNLNFTYNAK